VHSLYRSALIKYVIKLFYFFAPLISGYSRYPAAGLERRRRRKHLLTQGRWRNEIFENLSLRLCVIDSAVYQDSIFLASVA